MSNENLQIAKRIKNDEFYTQYVDIEKEIDAYIEHNPNVFRNKIILLPCDDPEKSNFTKYFVQNFNKLRLKKLISTSYSCENNDNENWQLSLFEGDNIKPKGKILIYSASTQNKKDWKFLKNDGDFRSKEISKLRDEADIIITNPPFSLFRQFLSWIIEKNKKFIIIGNINTIKCKEVFPLIKANQIWIGATANGKSMKFVTPNEETKFINIGNTCWFTNVEHEKRHKPLELKTMEENILNCRRKIIRKQGYPKYDNYEAIEVAFTEAIPSDYMGVMGVPLSFLNKYCPEQFDIVGITSGRQAFECKPSKRYINPKQHNIDGTIINGSKVNTSCTLKLKEIPNSIYYTAENSDGPLSALYQRILIRNKKY